MHADIIDLIYEAAALPQRWSSLLHRIAVEAGAAGGLIVVVGTNGSANFVSERLIPLLEIGRQAGHFETMERTQPLFDQMPPNFVTDTDLRSHEDMRAMPVYRDFLIPQKMDAGAASIFQGADHDLICVSFEGFGSHAAARGALPGLDALRPHFGRALSLTSQIRRARDQAVVDGFDAIGSGAAIVGGRGKLRAFNTAFERRLGNIAADPAGRLRFAHAGTDAQFAAAIAGLTHRHAGGGSSLALPPAEGMRPCVMHIVPLRRDACDIFDCDGVLLLLAEADNRLVPNGDLLRLLFDLTPAEARLARALLQEEDLRRAAAAAGMGYESARIYLKAIFQKTATNRQASLIRLLGSYSSPGAARA